MHNNQLDVRGCAIRCCMWPASSAEADGGYCSGLTRTWPRAREITAAFAGKPGERGQSWGPLRCSTIHHKI